MFTLGRWNLEGTYGLQDADIVIPIPPQNFALVPRQVHPVPIFPLAGRGQLGEDGGYGASRISNVDRVLSTSIKDQRTLFKDETVTRISNN